MIERANKCPVCGLSMLARKDRKVICLNADCEWEIEAKRKDDLSLPTIPELIKDWNS